MLYLLLLLLAFASCQDFVVHMEGTEKTVRKRLESEGFAIMKTWNTPNWYHVRCIEQRCATGNHQLRSAARKMEELTPLIRKTRSDVTSLQYHITCERFGTPMPYCQNILPLWNDCLNGTGVAVAVVDDGVDTQNTDLIKALDLSKSIDVNFGSPTPDPAYGASHGTSCAAIIGAEPGNGVCGSGIAHGADVVGIRLLAAYPTSAQEAEALSHLCESIDIYSNSWGPRDDIARLDGMSAASIAALEHCLSVGRGGRGSIYVWAAGNGGRYSGNTNFDGYSNSRYTISVAAVTSEGRRPSWGEIGASNLITAASSGGGLGIVTSTRYDPYGRYDRDGCRMDFGGTSASAPQVAAIIALLLQRRPDLSWRDVRHLVVHSGQLVDRNNAEAPWFINSAGLWFSEAFGFGVIDAKGLLDASKNHTLLPSEKTHSTGTMSVSGTRVAPGEVTTYRWSITDRTVTKISDIEIRIHAHFEGTFKDMYSLVLIAPNGERVRLVRPHSATDRDIAWTFTTPALWNTNPIGDWRLETTNGSPNAGFSIDDVRMNIYGI